MLRQAFAFALLTAATVAAEDKVTMLTIEGEGANYWPRWRGPSAQGYVKGSGYPDTWSSSDNVVWRVSIPGEGNSSPIVWRDWLFLTTSRTGGQKLSLMAFNRGNGKLRWETSIPQRGVERGHAKNGHASATPVTDGKRIYASFGTHGLFAFDFEGNIAWNSRVMRLDNYHGSAGSPVLHQNSVIIYQDHQAQSYVAAFHKETGKLIWRTDRDARTGQRSRETFAKEGDLPFMLSIYNLLGDPAITLR